MTWQGVAGGGREMDGWSRRGNSHQEIGEGGMVDKRGKSGEACGHRGEKW